MQVSLGESERRHDRSVRYVATWPTYPVPTPLRDDEGEVVTFSTRQEAIQYAEDAGVPFPADNVAVYKGGAA